MGSGCERGGLLTQLVYHIRYTTHEDFRVRVFGLDLRSDLSILVRACSGQAAVGRASRLPSLTAGGEKAGRGKPRRYSKRCTATHSAKGRKEILKDWAEPFRRFA